MSDEVCSDDRAWRQVERLALMVKTVMMAVQMTGNSNLLWVAPSEWSWPRVTPGLSEDAS